MDDSCDPSPEKSRSDLREYRIVRLKNGIEAILVKVPEGQSSKAAVSVAVNAGSMHEPDALGGLAHFVEHCVFLGNKKYPNRNSLDKLLSKHNGYSNAHTEMEYTAYYLEVNKEALSKAVDIFAAALEGPSFDEEMCCAELEAVDSEFHEILNNDDCRVEQMVCVLSSDDHKYRKFTWGNRASLMKFGGATLVSEAKSFFETHYTPDRMKVSIVSECSFERMEQEFLAMFERINRVCADESNRPPISMLAGCSFPVPESRLPVTVYVKPVAEVHQLILIFQLPAILEHYRKKPVDYIAHLVGHEGRGSLIHALREANLAVDISAGVGSDGYSCNSGLCWFEIKLNLTEEGMCEWERVKNEYIFAYLEKLTTSDQVFEELRAIGSFQFHETTEESTKDPIDTAEELAVQMLDHFGVDRSDILIYDYIYDEFDPDLIGKFLSFIVPQKAIAFLVTGHSSFAEKAVVKEPIFGITYSIQESDAKKFDQPPPTFTIPPLPNNFIPENATCGPRSETETEKVYVEPTRKAVFAGNEKMLEILCFNKTRSQPSLRCDIRIKLNLAETPSVESFVKTHLFVAYITDLLEPDLYCAKLVGYSVSISAMPPGKGSCSPAIEICVNGFQDKILHVTEMIVSCLQSGDGDIDSKRFARVIEVLKRGYANEEIHPVSTQAVNARKTALSAISFFRANDKLKVLLNLIQIGSSLLHLPPIHSGQVLLSGSYLESHPDDLHKLISPMITRPSDDSPSLVVQNINVETSIVEPSLNPNEPTSCLVIYYQLSSEFSVEVSAIADVLSDLFSEPFFDSLRTEEQLGYSVQCGSRYTNGSIGIEFLIQSSSETPEKMIGRIERFIERFYKKEIHAMTDSEFDDQINALVESLRETPTSLGREAKDLWTEVTEKRYMWDLNERIGNEIRKEFLGKKAKIQELIQEYFIRGKNRRIVVSVNGGARKI